MRILRIYDNGGKTADRYTVYYDALERKIFQPGAGLCKGNIKQRYIYLYNCLCMSEYPFHPQGIGTHSNGQLGRHNGKRITFKQLPPDCQRAVKNDLKILYEELPLIPSIIAEAVCGREYTGQEWSFSMKDPQRIAEFEALRKKMTPACIKAFVVHVDKRCKAAYDTKAKWFMEIVDSKTNTGRDQLYIWVTHWLTAWLKKNVKQ